MGFIQRVIEILYVANVKRPAGPRPIPPHCRAITNLHRPGEYVPYHSLDDERPALVTLPDVCSTCGESIKFLPNHVRLCAETAYIECCTCAGKNTSRDDDPPPENHMGCGSSERAVPRPQYEAAVRAQVAHPCTCPTCNRVLEAGQNFYWASMARDPEIYHDTGTYAGNKAPTATDLDPRLASPQYFECDKCREHYLCPGCGRHAGKRDATPIADAGRGFSPEWRRSAREAGERCPTCRNASPP
jgi:hypothetical protein